MKYVTSIKDLSTDLISAFMEADGEHTAVVLVDGADDVVPVRSISYNSTDNCIIVRVGYGDRDLRGTSIKREIAEVNKS